MAVESVEIVHRNKGALGEDDDWWSVCLETTSGKFYIKHEWDHVNPYRLSEGHKEGTEELGIEGYDGPGKDKIEAAVAELKERIVGL